MTASPPSSFDSCPSRRSLFLRPNPCLSNHSSMFRLIRIFPYKIFPLAFFSLKEANRAPGSPSAIWLPIYLSSKSSVTSAHRNFEDKILFQKTH